MSDNFNDRQKTKIVATVGPACNTKDQLLTLARAGVDVFRLNFSHGSHDDHKKIIDFILEINKEYNRHIGILADLQGPKLRVGKIENGSIEIAPEDVLTFVNTPCIGNKEKIYMSYEGFPTDVQAGETVLVDDGKVVLQVIETNKKDTVKLKVIHGHTLSSNKGVNLPNTKVSLPAMTEKDHYDLGFIMTQPVNWIALSFVRSPKDVKDLRVRLEEAGHDAKIIAKIEKPEAVEKIDKIIKHSNGIMIARGDLGIEIPIERLPLIQKNIIKKCIQRARPVIVATQMMDSMINDPSPTRAEVTDVANAVLDGADAVMLSGETSIGKHPKLVVDTMRKIIHFAEAGSFQDEHPYPAPASSTFLSDVVCFNASKTSDDVDAAAIVGMTASGYTAFKVSSYRPKASIFIFSDKRHMLATLNLVWGVKCYFYNKYTTTDETIYDCTEILKANGEVAKGELIVNIGSMPIEKRYRTNMMKITVVE